MTALLWKDKPVGDMESRWIVKGEDGNRELVQRLLPGKGDEGQDSTFSTSLLQPILKSPFINLFCPTSLSPASCLASTS